MLVEDIRLQAVLSGEEKSYGSDEDEVDALKSLSAIELGDKELRETVISHLMTKFGKLSEVIFQRLVPGYSIFHAFCTYLLKIRAYIALCTTASITSLARQSRVCLCEFVFKMSVKHRLKS